MVAVRAHIPRQQRRPQAAMLPKTRKQRVSFFENQEFYEPNEEMSLSQTRTAWDVVDAEPQKYSNPVGDSVFLGLVEDVDNQITSISRGGQQTLVRNLQRQQIVKPRQERSFLESPEALNLGQSSAIPRKRMFRQENHQANEAIAVISLPEPQPIWLRSLLGLQKVSSIVTLFMATTTLAVYGGTIYGQAKWTQQYQKLEKLRRDQQQLDFRSEQLKRQIAEQAREADAGLVPLDSMEPIFIEPASLRPASKDTNLDSAVLRKSLFETPLGY